MGVTLGQRTDSTVARPAVSTAAGPDHLSTEVPPDLWSKADICGRTARSLGTETRFVWTSSLHRTRLLETLARPPPDPVELLPRSPGRGGGTARRRGSMRAQFASADRPTRLGDAAAGISGDEASTGGRHMIRSPEGPSRLILARALHPFGGATPRAEAYADARWIDQGERHGAQRAPARQPAAGHADDPRGRRRTRRSLATDRVQRGQQPRPAAPRHPRARPADHRRAGLLAQPRRAQPA